MTDRPAESKASYEDFLRALIYPQRRHAIGLVINQRKAMSLINDSAAARAHHAAWVPEAYATRRLGGEPVATISSRPTTNVTAIITVVVVAIIALIIVGYFISGLGAVQKEVDRQISQFETPAPAGTGMPAP